MTTPDDPVIELLEVLVGIESVNPGLDPAGAGEAEIAAFTATWGRDGGLRVEELEATPGRPSVVLRGGQDDGGQRLLLCGHLDTVAQTGAAGVAGEVAVAAVADEEHASLGIREVLAHLVSSVPDRCTFTVERRIPPVRTSPGSRPTSPTSSRGADQRSTHRGLGPHDTAPRTDGDPPGRRHHHGPERTAHLGTLDP